MDFASTLVQFFQRRRRTLGLDGRGVGLAQLRAEFLDARFGAAELRLDRLDVLLCFFDSFALVHFVFFLHPTIRRIRRRGSGGIW